MENKDTRMNERWAPTDPDARGYAAPSDQRNYAQGDPARAGRGPAEIRAEIERTRADMSETVDAIEERLRPGTIVSRAAERARDSSAGTVKQMAARMQDMVPERAARTVNPVVTRIREHPVPATLAAVSLAWLAFAGKRPAYARDSRETGVGDRIGQVTSEATATAQSMAHETSDRMRRTTMQARGSARRFTRENALTAAAFATAAGMAVGFALPETRRENEWMGETRDAVLDRAKESANTAAQRVQHAAEDVKRVATDVIAGTDPGSGRGGDRR